MTAIARTGKTFLDGTCEIETDTNGHQHHLHYLSGGDGLFAIYTLDEKGHEAMNYIHKDYQGSFEPITNNLGIRDRYHQNFIHGFQSGAY